MSVTVPGTVKEAGMAKGPFRAPRGTQISCKGWQQEAALRMLLNNLDPEVAEKPEDLVVYGGTGKAARNWQCFHAMVRSLKALEADETLLVQSGKPVGVFRTHEYAPRVLLCNSNLVGHWNNWDRFHELDRAGLMMYGQMTAGSWIYIGTQGILQGTYETFAAAAQKHFGGDLSGKLVVSGGMGGMGGAQPLAATLNGGAFLGIDVDPERIKRRVKSGYCDVMVNDLDESLRILKNAVRKREPASVGLVGNCADLIPALAKRGVVPAYMRPLFCEGRGPFRWVALSGEPSGIYRTDQLVLEMFPQNEMLTRWIRLAQKRVRFQGLPARICWLGYGERAKFGLALNDLVARGELKAPIVIGRDHLDCGSVASPYRETEAMRDGSDAIADWPFLNAMLNTASGASWVSIHNGGGVGIGYSQHAGQVIVADGTPQMAARIERVLTNDPGIGVARHADAGYAEAADFARKTGIKIPMR